MVASEWVLEQVLSVNFQSLLGSLGKLWYFASDKGGLSPPFVPLHLSGLTTDMTTVVILLGGLVSSALASIGAIAFTRRRSRLYLFVALALGMLAAKAFVGSMIILQVIPYTTHHLIEHALDLAIALFLITAVYVGRTQPDLPKPKFDAIEEEKNQPVSESPRTADDD